MQFKNRQDAAAKLLPKLEKYKEKEDVILLAIPRGALEIGAVLRDKLGLPLDIVVTKKIGSPGNEEFAIGVVGPDGKYTCDEHVLSMYGIPMSYVADEAQRLRHVIKRRYEDYRGTSVVPQFKGKTAIVIDDGIATGNTARAAVEYLKREGVKKVVVAVPVSALDAADRIKNQADEFICLSIPPYFQAVGQFYEDFPQVSDEQAKELLAPKKN